MSILPVHSPHCFGIFKRSMIQADYLPLSEMLDSSVIAEAFEEDNIVFGIADEDVFTPAITLWAMVSQFLFKDTGRSCKAAAGRVVSLWAQTAGRVVFQNAGNFCRAKAKIPTTTIRKITLRLASEAELRAIAFDDPASAIDDDVADRKLRKLTGNSGTEHFAGGRADNLFYRRVVISTAEPISVLGG